MSDNTHDPPTSQLGPMKIDEPLISPERLALLGKHEKYLRMRDRLQREPIDLIREMKHGGYRYKCKRGMPGVLALDRGGNPVPERMSFRQIAPILTGTSGVEVTYESVRRWWETVFPDEGDEPEPDHEPDPAPVVVPVKRTVRRRTLVAPPVGDDHAEVIRAAAAKVQTTNPDVPSAVFLPAPE